MSTTSLFKPHAPVEDRGPGGPAGPGAPPPRRMRDPRRRPPIIALLVAGLLGGLTSTGVLAATGALNRDDGSGTTTVLQSGGTSGTSANSSGTLNASALYASTAAGVVDITARGTSTASGQPAGPFGAPPQQSQATGSGFVVDKNGDIVTAAHVVDGASSVTVTFQDGTSRKATVLGQDEATDVAVLKVDPSGLTLRPLPLASSASLDVGDQVAAIGDPFGYARSISTGIVSGLDRTIEAPNGFTVAHAIQTDAALNPGNSGGPVLDASGRVVGIVDQIATGSSSSSSSEQSSGVGFAVPIDLVASELGDLKAGHQVSHPYLGVSTSTATATSAGAQVGSVAANGPAADAGVRAGDVVTKFGDKTIGDGGDLVAAIAGHKPGDRVELTVRRGSTTKQLTVTLGKQPTQRAAQSPG
jgi:putative serine protease PepD